MRGFRDRFNDEGFLLYCGDICAWGTWRDGEDVRVEIVFINEFQGAHGVRGYGQ